MFKRNTKLNQIKINDLHKRNYLVTKSKVRSIHSSLAIEDNSLTLQDVEKISNKKTILGKKKKFKKLKMQLLYMRMWVNLTTSLKKIL